jgi:hypothetical protein
MVNGRLYTGTYAIPMVWVAIGAAADFSTTQAPSFAAFRDATGEVVYVADGGALNKTDGATTTLNLAGTPNVTRIWVYNRRLFGTGNPASPQTVYWSDLDNGDTLGVVASGGGEAVVRTFGQSNLVTGATLKASSLMFHRGGVSRFTGWSQDDIAIQSGTQGVSSDVGTIIPQGVIAVENQAFFMSDRGFFTIDDYGVTNISRKIHPVFSDQFDFSQAGGVVVGHNKLFEEIWWFLPGLGCYVYNYDRKAWTGPMSGLFLDVDITGFISARNATGEPIMLATADNGFVYHIDAPNAQADDVRSDGTQGNAIVMAAQLRRFFAKSLPTRKAWRWVYLTAQLRGNRSVQLEMSTETSSAAVPVTGAYGDVWDPSEVWDPTQVWSGIDQILYRVPAGGTGQYLDVTIADSGDCQAIYNSATIIGYSLGLR